MRLYKDVINLILDFIPKYKLRDWIDESKLDYSRLSPNEKAIPILEKHLDQVNWSKLSQNPAAVSILEKNLDKVDWKYLSSNESSGAISLLEKNLKEGGDKVDWTWLSGNTSPRAISILEKNLQEGGDKVDRRWLSMNPSATSILEKDIFENGGKNIYWDCLSEHPDAISICRKIFEKIGNTHESLMEFVSSYPGAIDFLCKVTKKRRDKLDQDRDIQYLRNWPHISAYSTDVSMLEQNLDKVDWTWLCANTTPSVISLLEKNIEDADKGGGEGGGDKVCWSMLSRNPAAISILEKRFKENREEDDIHYYGLSENPAIFVPYRDPVLFDILMEIEIF